MDIEDLKSQITNLIDQWAAKQPNATVTFSTPNPDEDIAPTRELPKDKRVVRTKTSGDKVYLLDEVKKTRQWVATGEILADLGFEQSDVVEVADTELFKYSMGAVLYRAE